MLRRILTAAPIAAIAVLAVLVAALGMASGDDPTTCEQVAVEHARHVPATITCEPAGPTGEGGWTDLTGHKPTIHVVEAPVDDADWYRWVIAHEAGHVHDVRHFTELDRHVIADLAGWPHWDRELYADAYADAVGYPHGYGQPPTDPTTIDTLRAAGYLPAPKKIVDNHNATAA